MVNGIINVYKEKGYTSFDVVAKMRGIFGQKKIGHTGTLDPDAQGVLPVCLGKATKVCDLLTDKDKVYKATMLLGIQTDTLDISGKVCNKAMVNVTEQQVRDVISTFVGTIEQVPPMYSALKVNGKKLYELAREGKTIERKARKVSIYDITIDEICLPEVVMTVSCSKGTYIRSLCDDIGTKLGCYGCMKELLRTKVACFDIGDAYKISEIEKLKESIVLPVDMLFENIPAVNTVLMAQKLIENGNRIPAEMINADGNKQRKYDDEGRYRIYNPEDSFVGIYTYKAETDDFKPVKIFME
ncbi:MAG: tRNA pseudouridine(55) synthase TruB [Lachnospiraceae bacterium]|nr:tRNA pseudouridine(55) synthase TruB [uncultured Agathobacter sp.]MCI7114194.1 tRNA pseudouridine(55) synthase TruB [Lachnobacterium sp.]MDD6138520.1 tRNA pseudouridine(55) synthase TruB [Lachnospiraceae bacterium]MDY6155901.1 tRNA pseudouridine(55) synthase TruB [Agathobacter sp.]